jgi:cysteine-rich repeat protein
MVTGSEQCDDGNTADLDGCSSACLTEYKTTARWHIKTADGTAQSCPVGFDTAAVYSQPLDGNNQPVGQPLIDLFSCADGQGTTNYLGNGVFRTWVAITNSSGTSTYAQTLAADVDLTAMNMIFDGDIVEDGGYFSWAWVLQGASSNSPLTCSQVTGIAGVELVTTLTSGGNAIIDQFSCEDGFGYTSALAAGSYSVSADAFNSANQSIGTAPTLTNKVIGIKNAVTDLGTITIPIDGM